MKRVTFCAGAAVAALLASNANATWLDANFTGSGAFAGDVAFWNQSETPTPISSQTGVYTDIPILKYSDTFGGAAIGVTYYGTSGLLTYAGGFADDAGDFGLMNGGVVYGPVIYGGTEAAPTFAPGTYAETNGTLVLSVNTTGVPEPAGWAMMLVGAGLVGASLRRRSALAA